MMGDPYLDYLHHPDRSHHCRFIETYLGPMTRLARRIAPRLDLADDAVQESLLRLGRAEEARNGMVRNPRAYVFRTVINVARNLLREEAARARHEGEAARRMARSEPDPLKEIEEREAAREVYRAIDRLPPEFRVVLHLSLVEGLSYREIAEATGSPVDTVSSRIHRGRARLKRLLGPVVLGLGCACLSELRAGGPHAAGTLGLWRGAGRAGGWLRGSSIGAITAMMLVMGPENRREGPMPAPPAPALRFVEGEVRPPVMGREDAMRNVKTTSVLAAGVLAASAALGAAAEPGDLIAFLPSAAPGPVDIAYDPEEDGYWVTSFPEFKIYHLGRDLKADLGTIPLPFENPSTSSTGGIAYHPDRKTLFVADAQRLRIHEIARDGTPTGTSFPIPHPETSRTIIPTGLAYNPGGDGGRGSLIAALGPAAMAVELSLEGALLGSFPRPEDIGRVLGSGAERSIDGVEPILDGTGKLAGYYVTATGSDEDGSRRLAILKLGPDGAPTGVSISLEAAAGPCYGLLRRPFPHPETGGDVDSFICVQAEGSRFVILAGGEPAFHPVFDLRCAQAGRRVELTWSSPQAYDAIEVLRGCEVLASLPGDAVRWDGEILTDGNHQLSVAAVKGFNSATTGPCTLVLGPGRTLNSVPPPAKQPYGGPCLASNGKDLLVVAHDKKLFFYDLELTPLREATVSSFFLSGTEQIAAVAFSPEPETLFLYHNPGHRIGTVDFQGNLLESFDAHLPNLREDPTKPPLLGDVHGLAFDPSGQEGRGTFWVQESAAEKLYELDRGGNVLRELAHPFKSSPLPLPLETPIWGLAPAGGFGSGQLLVAGQVIDRPHPGFSIFRMDLATEGIVPGSEVPFTQSNSLLGAAEARQGDRARLYAVTVDDIREIEAGPSTVPAPTLLFGRQAGREDAAELWFRNNGSYDSIEVFRDCQKVASIDGSATGHIDRPAPRGLHEYAVRGLRGGRASAEATCRVQVGAGAILGSASTESVMAPGQVAFDPVGRQLFVLAKYGSKVCRFGEDLQFIEECPVWMPPMVPKALAVRIDPLDRPLLYMILSDSGGGAEAFYLTSQTLDWVFEEMGPMDAPPMDRYGVSQPLGLTWDPEADTFWYLETRSETFVEIDLQGKTLRTIPHPAPPDSRFLENEGFAFVPERSSFLTTILRQEDADLIGCSGTCYFPSRVVEVDLLGRLTGFEIPLRAEVLRVSGIAVAGSDLIALGLGESALARLQAFPADGSPDFIRGDVNLDSTVDLTDPITLLTHLYLGGPQPGCLDAADADDSGGLDLSDAISILTYLYLGGSPPPPPFPGKGDDFTGDALDCARGQ